MKQVICKLKKHKRDKENTYLGTGKNDRYKWVIKCVRCGYVLEYESPHARLISTEMKFGFTGE